MDVLKDKQYKQYDMLSRYIEYPVYYNSLDNKYIYGLTSQMKRNTEYVSHAVLQSDTLESIAFKYYGRPDYYWIIAMYNNIIDSLEPIYPKYKELKIPVLSNVEFK